MLFSESRYDFQRCLWPDIWDSIRAVANPKGLGADHPKFRTTVSLCGLIIHIAAFRKKHDLFAEHASGTLYFRLSR